GPDVIVCQRKSDLVGDFAKLAWCGYVHAHGILLFSGPSMSVGRKRGRPNPSSANEGNELPAGVNLGRIRHIAGTGGCALLLQPHRGAIAPPAAPKTGRPTRQMLTKSLEWKDMTRAFIAAVVVVWAVAAVNAAPQSKNGNGAPRYVVDPFWPKDLPDYWTLGQVAGIAVDGQDNIWIIHRPRTLMDDEKGAQKMPPETRCC